MSDFKVDLRLPVKLYKKHPFTYVGPDFSSLPLGLISDSITHQENKFQRLYPFLVRREKGQNITDDILFCFAFIYLNNDNEKVIFLTQPQYLDSETPEALEVLLLETENLARYIKSNTIEIEYHEKITGNVAYPTSLSFLSYKLDDDIHNKPNIDLIERWGYIQNQKITCFESNIEELVTPSKERQKLTDKYQISHINPNDYNLLSNEYSRYRIRSFKLSNSDNSLEHSKVPFFEDTAHSIKRRRRFFGKGPIDGYMRWIPNIMENISGKHTPYPYLHYQKLEKHNYETGKIFDWGFIREDRDVINSLLIETIDSMKQRGIKRLQITNIKDKFVQDFFIEKGSKPIHKIKLYKKELN
jgi:hypothetical protein